MAAPDVISPAVTSFGASRLLTDQDLAMIAARSATYDESLQDGFARSTALSPNLALDTAYRLDLSSHFGNFDPAVAPTLNMGSSFLALADAGRYGGVTYAPSPNLQLRLGASAWNGRLDTVSVDAVAATGLPLAYDRSSVSSVVAGASWEANDWVRLGVNAVSSIRSNTPLAYGPVSPIGGSASTTALEVSARFHLGNNWVTTTHFAQGFTQLNQRTGADSFDAQAYSITVAKHGVFGDDAVGFSLSRPAAGMIGSFSSFTTAGDLPPIVLPTAKTAARETDFQIGYVTSFETMGGQLALQANAAYQMNVQGQNGASAVSMVAGAKFKF